MIPLSNWLQAAPDTNVATSIERSYSKDDLCQRIYAWQASLALEPGQRWAVYHQDTLEFLAILFALWQTDCIACLPADICDETVARLAPSVAGFIGEFEHADNHPTPPSSQTHSMVKPFKQLTRAQQAIEIYTSGSTGEPKPICKTIAIIEDEIAAVNQLWQLEKNTTLLATVPHQHLFGLTFRLFWPLLTGRLIYTHTCSFTEDVFRCAQHLSPFALISTPSHLKRLNDQLDWSNVTNDCQAVISSAAPLDAQDSQHAHGILNTPIWEIYGSSETGAIAWRCQQKSELWQLLPTLTIEQFDSSSLVKGPYIAPIYQPLGDTIELRDATHFKLLGRKDRIEKVEGKRLSLTKLEQTLERSEWIKAAKALVLKRKRDEVVIVAELSEAGTQQQRQHNNKWLAQQLKQTLKTSFDSVLLPRRWRFLSSFPYNSRGKVSMESLQTLFEKQDVKWPTTLSQSRHEQQLELTLYVPKELIYFEGHFDKHPILPGVVQTHWAQFYGREHFPISGTFTRLEAIKFQHVIFPDSEVLLTLTYQPESNKLSFQYSSDKGVHSSGRICYA